MSANSLLVHSGRGWSRHKRNPNGLPLWEAALDLGAIEDPDEIARQANAELGQTATPAEQITAAVREDGDLIAGLDYIEGDTAPVPDSTGALVPQLIQSITYVEDDRGKVIATPQLGDVIFTPEARAQNALLKMTGASRRGASKIAQPVNVPRAKEPAKNLPEADFMLTVAWRDAGPSGSITIPYTVANGDTSSAWQVADADADSVELVTRGNDVTALDHTASYGPPSPVIAYRNTGTIDIPAVLLGADPAIVFLLAFGEESDTFGAQPLLTHDGGSFFPNYAIELDNATLKSYEFQPDGVDMIGPLTVTFRDAKIGFSENLDVTKAFSWAVFRIPNGSGGDIANYGDHETGDATASGSVSSGAVLVAVGTTPGFVAEFAAPWADHFIST